MQDRARLESEVKGSLERVRKTAENWRTGMAGLTALVTASLLFKGRATIGEYEPVVQYTLGLLVLCSLTLSVASLWLFLTAAYGRLEVTSAQSVIDSGGVDVRNLSLATSALGDLRTARRLGLAAAAVLAAALIVSWYGPASRRSQAYVKVVVASDSTPGIETPLCGELKGLDGKLSVIQVGGEPEVRRIRTAQLVSLSVVSSCSP